MPSSANPSTSIFTVGGAPSPVGGGGGAAALAALEDHILDPTNAHVATAIAYVGGPAWADGTPNPFNHVEGQLDKIISDLATGSGTGKIRYNGSGFTFADGSNLAAGNLETVLDTLVTTLGSTTTTDSGSRRIGVEAYNTGVIAHGAGTLLSSLLSLSYADNIQFDTGGNSGFPASGPLPSASVQATFDSLVEILVSQTLNLSGAHNIGTYARTPWIDTTTNPADVVFDALDKIITDLGQSIPSFSGAHKVGCAARGAWLDTLTNPATNTHAAIAKIITDLSDQVGATTDGAARIGASAVGDLSVGTVRSQLNELDTEWGRLDRAQTWTSFNTYTARIRTQAGAQAISGDDTFPAIEGTTLPPTNTGSRLLLIKAPIYFTGDDPKWVRIYTNGNINGIEITLNCLWDDGDNLWHIDDGNNNNEYATCLRLSETELALLLHNDINGGTWADTFAATTWHQRLRLQGPTGAGLAAEEDSRIDNRGVMEGSQSVAGQGGIVAMPGAVGVGNPALGAFSPYERNFIATPSSIGTFASLQGFNVTFTVTQVSGTRTTQGVSLEVDATFDLEGSSHWTFVAS